tara:strand:+ start:115 stop:543 length:429 start_codon:yes stop_codon:yes gene_type:complete
MNNNEISDYLKELEGLSKEDLVRSCFTLRTKVDSQAKIISHKDGGFDRSKYIDKDYYSPIPCPNCGSKVSISDDRNCSTHSIYASCENRGCGGMYFHTDSQASLPLHEDVLQDDWDIVAVKYYQWASQDCEIVGYGCNGEWK